MPPTTGSIKQSNTGGRSILHPVHKGHGHEGAESWRLSIFALPFAICAQVGETRILRDIVEELIS
jgi:hypothetical protein